MKKLTRITFAWLILLSTVASCAKADEGSARTVIEDLADYITNHESNICQPIPSTRGVVAVGFHGFNSGIDFHIPLYKEDLDENFADYFDENVYYILRDGGVILYHYYGADYMGSFTWALSDGYKKCPTHYDLFVTITHPDVALNNREITALPHCENDNIYTFAGDFSGYVFTPCGSWENFVKQIKKAPPA